MSFSKQLVLGLAASLFSAAYGDSSSSSSEEYVLPSSCIDLEDGEHQLKLMDGDVEDAPIVTVTCSNGYTVLDVSKDSNLESYFNTFMKHHTAVAGPTNDIHPNWEGWYMPDDGSSEYVVSPDCNTCEYDHDRQLYTTDELHKTAYMMTGTMFGCFWNLKGEHNFDEDYATYQCYFTTGEINAVGDSIRSELTDYSSESEWDMSGVCAFSVRASDHTVADDAKHDACTADYKSLNMAYNANYGDEDMYHLKPSIGTEGQFCVCTKPSTTNYYTVTNDEYIKSQLVDAVEITPEKSSKIKLYQSDFDSGTYRITKKGTYKIMEDIVFDFNADYEEPNSATAWWPHADQSEEYPGAGDYHNSYFMGFWAGIVVEADDVTIDLNGHSLEMSQVFYHQQRWFTTIALQGQYFLPGQGIGFFGADPHFAQNIVIKDGTVGLSSHHGIHGHFNKNVLIENVHVRDFETHGIQFNGFDGITIKNCEVGPTSQVAYFKGEYGHARTLLPRFQLVADENPHKVIHFYGRNKPTGMQDIVDELQKQTDMAYNYVVNGVEYDDDDESWISAKELFIDDTNLPNGAAMYGIFLNTYGASVLTYNLYTSFYSYDATVKNTVIHGLRHSMNEYVRMSFPQTGNLFMNALHAPFDASQVLESLTEFDTGEPKYKGSVLTDAALAMEKFSNNWNYLQAQLIMDNKMLSWSQKGGNVHGMDGIQIGCNIDVMIHSGKGINGLRIDGVDGVVISNVEMYDITEETPLGRSDCGEYSEFDGTADCVGECGGHFRQTMPMQTGFSGTMVQGINVNAAKNIVVKDVSIHDLESHYGPVFGISVWPAVDISFEGTIETKLLQAGSQVADDRFTYESRPNIAPEGCGIRLYSEFTSNGYTYTQNVDSDSAKSIKSSCVESHVACFDEDGVYTHLGDHDDSAECSYKTESLLAQGEVWDHADDPPAGKQVNSPSQSVGQNMDKKGRKQKNAENVLTDPSMVSHANHSTTHGMFVNLLLAALIIGLFALAGYKCLKKSRNGKSLLGPRRADEEHSLISDHDDGARYTVL